MLAALREKKRGWVVECSNVRFDRGTDLEAYILRNAPTTVVNCMGYAGSEDKEHLLVNACFPRVIADVCVSLKSLSMHISTNAVFSADESRFWLPSDRTDPSTAYEISKRMGEDPRTYVVRASFIGQSFDGRGLFGRLRRGEPYFNRKWNGVTAWTLARYISDVVSERDGTPFSALEHVHSPGATSFREIANLLGSSSRCGGERRDSKLLGGGKSLPPFENQLRDYAALRNPEILASSG